MEIFIIVDRILENEQNTNKQKLLKLQKIKDTVHCENEDDYHFIMLVINDAMNGLEIEIKKGLK